MEVEPKRALGTGDGLTHSYSSSYVLMGGDGLITPNLSDPQRPLSASETETDSTPGPMVSSAADGAG